MSRILFIVGATGGHLMPALALAQEFRKREHEVFFLIRSSSGRAKQILESQAIPYGVLPGRSGDSWVSRYIRYGLFFPRLMSMLDSLFKLGPFQAVVATGSLDTLGPVLLAWHRRIPIFLLEQNIWPGRANRFLKGFSHRVYGAWPHLWGRGMFGRKGCVVGNPLRAGLERYDPALARLFFHLAPHRKTVLILGGSQGARFLNHTIVSALGQWDPGRLSSLQIIHGAGERDCSHVKDQYRKLGISAHVSAFIEAVDYAYSAADVVISRAGGLTLTELLFFQRPALLVPYPHALDDHQRWNARFLAQQGMAFFLDEKNFSKARFKVLLETLLFDDVTIQRMKGQMRSWKWIQNSRETMVQDMLKRLEAGCKL